MPERLDKFLTSQNICTRKEAARLVRSGLVLLNGQRAQSPAQKLDPQTDQVTVEGKAVEYRRYAYIMMNKPAGVLSATEDRHTPTVLDLLPPSLRRRGLFPAGRLDKDTTGLLLLTDDGPWAHKMLAPKSHVYKLYRARLQAPITPEDITAFEKGVAQGGMTFAPARLYTLPGEDPLAAYVEIREGKFHQVKRMFQAIGNQVLGLTRLRIGALYLDAALPPGACRLLTGEEALKVFQSPGPPKGP